jgi:transglutaminase-like putative cysteine protease
MGLALLGGRCDAATLRLEQSISYRYDAPVTDLHQRLMIVPRATHGGQSRTAWDLNVCGAAVARRRDGCDRFGNVVVDLELPEVAEEVSFELTVEVGTGLGAELDGEAWDPSWMTPSRLTGSGPALGALAADIAPGRIRRAAPHLNALADALSFGPSSLTEPADIVHAVFAAMSYEWGITDVTTTATEALSGGRGVCQDYAHIMLSICHLVGLPARYVSGHLVGEGGSHAWVEVLHPIDPAGYRWRAEAWDPTHDRRADGPNYLTVAVGRDYFDVAPMSGYYEGDASGTLRVRKRLVLS